MKSSLNPVYLQNNEMEKILKVMKGIDLTDKKTLRCKPPMSLDIKFIEAKIFNQF